MNTTKRTWLPRKEWAAQQVASIDATLRQLAGPEPDWRRRLAISRTRGRLLERRGNLTRIACTDVDDSPTPF